MFSVESVIAYEIGRRILFQRVYGALKLFKGDDDITSCHGDISNKEFRPTLCIVSCLEIECYHKCSVTV